MLKSINALTRSSPQLENISRITRDNLGIRISAGKMLAAIPSSPTLAIKIAQKPNMSAKFVDRSGASTVSAAGIFDVHKQEFFYDNIGVQANIYQSSTDQKILNLDVEFLGEPPYQTQFLGTEVPDSLRLNLNQL